MQWSRWIFPWSLVTEYSSALCSWTTPYQSTDSKQWSTLSRPNRTTVPVAMTTAPPGVYGDEVLCLPVITWAQLRKSRIDFYASADAAHACRRQSSGSNNQPSLNASLDKMHSFAENVCMMHAGLDACMLFMHQVWPLNCAISWHFCQVSDIQALFDRMFLNLSLLSDLPDSIFRLAHLSSCLH